MRNRPTRGMINILKYKIRNSQYSKSFNKSHLKMKFTTIDLSIAAYENGRKDEEKVMVKFIGDWQPNKPQTLIEALKSLIENEKLHTTSQERDAATKN